MSCRLITNQMRIKNYFYLMLFFLTSCNFSSSDKKNDNVAMIMETKYHLNEGIILTDKIKIYDNNQNEIKEISTTFGEVVKIDSISISKYNLKKTDDRCDLHNFVKIKGKDFSAWVYGDKIFEKENAKRDFEVKHNNYTFEILPTKNFSIGVYDKELEMLSFCESGTQSPVLFYNGVFKKYEFIPILNKNEVYYDFFTLDSHDGWEDNIIDTKFKDNVLTLNIVREQQEGFTDIILEIKIDKDQSTGKVVKCRDRD